MFSSLSLYLSIFKIDIANKGFTGVEYLFLANCFIALMSTGESYMCVCVCVCVIALGNSLFLQARKRANVVGFHVVRNRSYAIQPYLSWGTANTWTLLIVIIIA